MTPRSIPKLLAFALMASSQIFHAAQAQDDFPNRPIRIIVPFAPGGSNDVVMRLLAPALTQQLGQSVVVDNKPGGGATIGMTLVAKAAPDGYTLGACAWDKAAIAQAIKETLQAAGLKMPQLAMPVRVLVLGTPQTPSLDAVLALFSREEVLRRLSSA